MCVMFTSFLHFLQIVVFPLFHVVNYMLQRESVIIKKKVSWFFFFYCLNIESFTGRISIYGRRSSIVRISDCSRSSKFSLACLNIAKIRVSIYDVV